MPRAKKPSVPKFEPMFIADFRQAVRSLGISEAERTRIFNEDFTRITVQRATAYIERRAVLRQHLEAELGVKLDDDSKLLVAVANKYVEDFAVEVGRSHKRPGPKKIGDRFKTVTEVERRKFELGLEDISAAIEAVAKGRKPSIRAPELSTKYYACLKEIHANEQASELLNFWRGAMTRLSNEDLQDFDFLFWECERECLGATQPHNVQPMKARKA
jgi:hypothetical protein